MRMGTFLLGGLMGAAAVVYLNRTSRSMMFSSFTQAGESVDRMMNKAKSTMKTMPNPMNQTTTASHTSGSSNITNTTSSDRGQLKEIINEDPKLKSTYNEILVESNLPANQNKPSSSYRTQ